MSMNPRELAEAIRHDRAFRAGMKFGWNLATTENDKRFDAALRQLTRDLDEARRELKGSDDGLLIEACDALAWLLEFGNEPEYVKIAKEVIDRIHERADHGSGAGSSPAASLTRESETGTAGRGPVDIEAIGALGRTDDAAVYAFTVRQTEAIQDRDQWKARAEAAEENDCSKDEPCK